jgi:hypothetical protein
MGGGLGMTGAAAPGGAGLGMTGAAALGGPASE